MVAAENCQMFLIQTMNETIMRYEVKGGANTNCGCFDEIVIKEGFAWQ